VINTGEDPYQHGVI